MSFVSHWRLNINRLEEVFKAILEKQKEEKMAKKKKVVTFKVSDGFVPRLVDDGSLRLLSPMPLTLRPGEVRDLKLGIESSVPLLIFGVASLENKGVVLQNGGAVDAGLRLVIKLANTSRDIVFLESKDTLAKAVILDCGEIELS